MRAILAGVILCIPFPFALPASSFLLAIFVVVLFFYYVGHEKVPELKWPCLIRSPFHSHIWRDAREQFQHLFPLASQSGLANWSDQET
jgi:hypothetical protein